ncbi:MAG: tetraacyldisaccharide 4'-kinase [Acidiferrobacteraceae bacterium]
MVIADLADRHWTRRTWLSMSLWPLSMLYCLFVCLHRQFLKAGAVRLPVPVVTIGNLTVGGTGKTPLVAWVAGLFAGHGYRPGVVARGYGGRARQWPQRVTSKSDPAEVGDEPVLLARRGFPVAVGPDRVAAARVLIDQHGCNVIVSDDGLQHWRLHRDVEVAVIDGVRRFGNGFCLPAGPLREPVRRIETVDARIVQGGVAHSDEWSMRLTGTEFVNVAYPERVRYAGDFLEPTIHAVAGIGYPQRFFDDLRVAGLDPHPHVFPDHHPFVAEDFDFADKGSAVIMTEKDAVKCERFACDNFWFWRVAAEPEPGFGPLLLGLLKGVRGG